MNEESSQAQEKTEQPTPKRLQDAKKKGQVPRSKELNTVAVMLGSAAYMFVFGGWTMQQLQQLVSSALLAAGDTSIHPMEAAAGLGSLVLAALLMLAPFMLALMVLALAGPAMMGGLVVSGDAATPKFERLNPIAGLKRIFSLQGLMELVKTLLKFGVLVGIAMSILWLLTDSLVGLATKPPVAGLAEAAGYIQFAFLALAGGLLLIAAIDAPFQLYSHFKKLRMTRQEVKDEFKETDGNPEMKGRLRRMQQEMAQRRMMAEIPGADVVITNPTHYAVALKYADKPDRAPRVVAKGADLVAARIRELALEHKITICSAPPLARAIFHNTELGQEIPAGLYLAVARVLAYVFQLRTARQYAGPMPEFPLDLPIPDDLQVPERNR